MSSDREFKNENDLKLDWRDYVAIGIASLETTFLPIVVGVVVLFVAAILLRH